MPLFLKIVAGVLLFPFTGTYSISIIKDLLSLLTDADEAKAYFAAASASNVRVEPFKQPVFSAGVIHAKLLAVDGRVLSIGSPFSQAYVDGHDHRIDSWIRGDGGEVPRHDAGFAVTGPIAVDLYRTMKLFWDTAVPDDVLPDLQGLDDPPPDHLPGPEPPPSLIDSDPDGICDMQVVRTLSQNRFAGKDEGEKGILEAYLRGIAEAEDFIYLENQYFTDDVIATALVERLRNNPKLQVILLVNIAPDTPTYPFKQRRLITRMRRAIRKFDTGRAAPRRVHALAASDPRGRRNAPAHDAGLPPRQGRHHRQQLGDGRLGESRWPVARCLAAERRGPRHQQLLQRQLHVRAARHRGQRAHGGRRLEQGGRHPAPQAVGGASRFSRLERQADSHGAAAAGGQSPPRPERHRDSGVDDAERRLAEALARPRQRYVDLAAQCAVELDGRPGQHPAVA